MALVLICYKIPYKDSALSTKSVTREISERRFLLETGDSTFSSSDHDRRKRRRVNANRAMVGGRGSLHFHIMTDVPPLQGACNAKNHLNSISEHVSQRENSRLVLYALESSTNEKQLKSLDSYFGKLQGNANQHSLDTSHQMTGRVNTKVEIKAKQELESLNAYLGKLNTDHISSTSDDQTTKDNLVATPLSLNRISPKIIERKLKSSRALRSKDGKIGSERFQALQQYDETCNLYLISILASVNIAVFLFEIASPVKNTDFELFSLPLLYGAKINHLILVGEWWRLVTPMFLHSGLLHIALGCWSLLTFGPQVCQGYGSFTFLLIYILGGISGNLTSFLHTPAPTVGGTGPVFAIIGAWLMYQIQNKDVISKDVSERLFQKAIITTALGFILSNLGPIDDWTHFGAAFTGIAYGFFTCPTLQLDDSSSGTGQEEGITVLRRYADPCKSLFLFTIFILVLSSLLFFMEPPNTLL